MTIYDISQAEASLDSSSSEPEQPLLCSQKDRLFSSLVTRVFFALLFVADLAWMVYSIVKLAVAITLHCLVLTKSSFLKKVIVKSFLSLKRSAVCAISLLMAFFSPSFGIMVACIYFIVHDKAGIDEVVPLSLKDQFQDFLKDLK